jgi:hypothetical protein
MLLGVTPFAQFHSIVSLIGIATGLVVVYGFFTSKRLEVWTAVFLFTTVLTSATGFGFPFFGLLPSHKIGILSLVLLAVAIFALYGRHLAGGWRATYVITSVIALYFNVFILFVQLFRKVPALHDLAPTQSEPPFVVTQLIVLAIFAWLGFASVRRFHPGTASAPAHAGGA